MSGRAKLQEDKSQKERKNTPKEKGLAYLLIFAIEKCQFLTKVIDTGKEH